MCYELLDSRVAMQAAYNRNGKAVNRSRKHGELLADLANQVVLSREDAPVLQNFLRGAWVW